MKTQPVHSFPFPFFERHNAQEVFGKRWPFPISRQVPLGGEVNVNSTWLQFGSCCVPETVKKDSPFPLNREICSIFEYLCRPAWFHMAQFTTFLPGVMVKDKIARSMRYIYAALEPCSLVTKKGHSSNLSIVVLRGSWMDDASTWFSDWKIARGTSQWTGRCWLFGIWHQKPIPRC